MNHKIMCLGLRVRQRRILSVVDCYTLDIVRIISTNVLATGSWKSVEVYQIL
jgi:hypothetical protein